MIGSCLEARFSVYCWVSSAEVGCSRKGCADEFGLTAAKIFALMVATLIRAECKDCDRYSHKNISWRIFHFLHNHDHRQLQRKSFAHFNHLCIINVYLPGAHSKFQVAN